MDSSPVVAISQVPIHGLDLDAAASTILAAALERRPLAVHLCNAYVLALASRDPDYAYLLRSGDLNLADGAPVAWFASRAGARIRVRPSGAELMDNVAGRGRADNVRHYLYGSTPQVVSTLATRLRRRHPGLELAGAESPPFGPVTPEQAAALAHEATASNASIIWVGLGTPKQDRFVHLVRQRFNGPCVPVGAAFDFISGAVPRAPTWMRQLGIEWLYRLRQEPGRLWKRYLWGNTQFLWSLARTGRILHHPPGPSA